MLEIGSAKNNIKGCCSAMLSRDPFQQSGIQPPVPRSIVRLCQVTVGIVIQIYQHQLAGPRDGPVPEEQIITKRNQLLSEAQIQQQQAQPNPDGQQRADAAAHPVLLNFL